MSPIFYHILHTSSALILFLGLGLICASPLTKNKPGSVLHGIGLLALLISGFGFLGKTGQMAGFLKMGYVWTMLAFFLFLGALPTLLKKGLIPRSAAIPIAIASAIILAYVGYHKPF